MRKKIIVASFLFLDVLFIIFIISGLVKLRQVKKARQEARVGEEVAPILEPLSSKIEVVSDIPGFTIEKADMSKLEEYLREWEVFGENKFRLRSTNQFVTVRKIIFHLTDQEQPYNRVVAEITEGKEELVEAVGERYEGNTLDFIVFFHPSYFKEEEPAALSEELTFYTLTVLYERTHSSEPLMERNKKAEEYAGVLLKSGKVPFKIEKR